MIANLLVLMMPAPETCVSQTTVMHHGRLPMRKYTCVHTEQGMFVPLLGPGASMQS